MADCFPLGQTRTRWLICWSRSRLLQLFVALLLFDQEFPLLDVFLLTTIPTTKVIIYMVTPPCPCVDPFGPDFNETLAETTPETGVAMAPDPAFLELFINFFAFCHRMLSLKVIPKAFPTQEGFFARFFRVRFRLIT